jgi:tetratricopeptide (TPR) repeat protein
MPRVATRDPTSRPSVHRRALALARVLSFGILLAALSLTAASAQSRQPARGEVSAETANGFVRLVFRFPDEVEGDVRLSNNVLVVSFRTPVNLNVDRLMSTTGGLVTTARLDPDTISVRMALSRRVTANAISAGDRLYVDLLPANWTGPPPGLPTDVVENLARRAREAERQQRQRQLVERQRRAAPVPVRVGSTPTFTRYVFELREPVAVSASRDGDTISLDFDAPLAFDLAAARAALPAAVRSIEADNQGVASKVRFHVAGRTDMRTFREDLNFVIDIVPGGDEAPAGAPGKPAALPVINPESGPVAARPAPAAPREQPKLQNPAPTAPPAATASSAPATAPAPQVAARPATPPTEPVAPATAAETPPRPVTPPAGDSARPGAAAPVVAALARQGDTLKLVFPFTRPVAGAVFRRADTLWMIFDTQAPINVAALTQDTTRTIRNATVTRTGDGQVVRVRLERPRLAGQTTEGDNWIVTLGDQALDPTRPLMLRRHTATGGTASASIAFEDAGHLHRLADPDVGDELLVVTGLPPARGLVRAQDLVEFRALATTHGIALQPVADNLDIRLAGDEVTIGRPGGLTLTSGLVPIRRPGPARAVAFDAMGWGFDRDASFRERSQELVAKAAEAPDNQKTAPRLELARFYLAHHRPADAKGVLDLVLAQDPVAANDPAVHTLRAASLLFLGRIEDAARDFARIDASTQPDVPVWRALALSRLGRHGPALEAFAGNEATIGRLPADLQRIVLAAATHSALAAGDIQAASRFFTDLDAVGVGNDMRAEMALLAGKIAERSGEPVAALGNYRTAVESASGALLAEARLRATILAAAKGQLSPDDLVNELELLTIGWRGDRIELEARQALMRAHLTAGRFREAFRHVSAVLSVDADSPVTRSMQDEAVRVFEGLYLDGRADQIPAVEALALYYDFQEMTPVGRRGDEMIRRLADRLASVELVEQAADLLQHQVDKRLEGAARTRTATRLAMLHLSANRPERAIQVLRATRLPDMPADLRLQRILVEARALGDLKRADAALDLLDGQDGADIDRLRADILWDAERWAETGAAFERLAGDRWRGFQPMTDAERRDVLRSAIAFALADDRLALERLRGRYAAAMAQGGDAQAFDVVTSGRTERTGEFRDIVRAIAGTGTLQAFLRDLRTRFPDAPPAAPAPATPAVPAPAPGASAPAPTRTAAR